MPPSPTLRHAQEVAKVNTYLMRFGKPPAPTPLCLAHSYPSLGSQLKCHFLEEVSPDPSKIRGYVFPFIKCDVAYINAFEFVSTTIGLISKH